MEIRIGSSDSHSSRHKSSNFKSVQRRSNESQYGRKKRSGVKRKLTRADAIHCTRGGCRSPLPQKADVWGAQFLEVGLRPRCPVFFSNSELNGRIREFEKPWMFHVLAGLRYPCIPGVDIICGSEIFLDFDRKSLANPDSQIDTVKLVMATDGTECAIMDIERLFDEARRNTKPEHEKWAKYFETLARVANEGE
ncbi:uncharacterized protein TNCV_2598141 [Trichonephila clavipes]|nr:uncharacterized protein TNCV_2598141 [Trichonephila clavipes]